MSIEVTGLTKTYGAQKAVNDISFKLNQGEIVGFLGPNGAGKSTTMKIITGYLKPDQGSAVVCGINVSDDPIATKRKIGYLPEANPLYPDMYVKEYLDFIAGIHQLKNKKARIDEVIQQTGLVPEVKKRIGQLSKGYRQRVGLAAALVHDPEVLILDEPTSGLDPNQIIEIRELIRQNGLNKTVLFSSHILQEVEAICERVIIINKGQVVADDKVSMLQAGGKSRQVIIVEFKEPADMVMLEKMDEVERVEKIQNTVFRLHTSNSEKVRRQLLQLSIEQNYNIISLQSESNSLEDIFRSLTTSA